MSMDAIAAEAERLLRAASDAEIQSCITLLVDLRNRYTGQAADNLNELLCLAAGSRDERRRLAVQVDNAMLPYMARPLTPGELDD